MLLVRRRFGTFRFGGLNSANSHDFQACSVSHQFVWLQHTGHKGSGAGASNDTGSSLKDRADLQNCKTLLPMKVALGCMEGQGHAGR